MCKAKYSAIVLAAGQGKRMNSDVHKQYILVQNAPVLYYTLKAFETSQVDDIILVCGKGEVAYCKEEIIKKYGFKKVTHVIEGGKERYDSVYEGLKVLSNTDYVLIHDGARLLVDQGIIERNIEEVKRCNACITAVPTKDTVKIVNEDGIVESTPNRKNVWNIQTPQTFEYQLIKNAYDQLYEKEEFSGITDDAMVVEKMTDKPIKVVSGEYYNIKVTTPEDLIYAEYYLNN